ncbi:growth/differentiation factor 6-A-like [Actinia tenebrosa]|uniref:Growth/differentiation factor 6-A-like n=1 Tax=Actinia tenebrosa TaxID=6105 RepID=A0A6P8HZG4_ACTTE|nr:growth/differentiation factor 6-A-like [Actinia tenebrosa]
MQISSALWILGLLSLINAVLILQFSEACSEMPDNKLDEKWEALREPWLRKRALEITQKQMLNVLGLTEVPRPNRRVIRPHAFMLDLYKRLSRGAKRKTTKLETRQSINTVRGVVDQEIYDRSVSQSHHQLYVFNLSTIPNTDKIIAAELRILRRPEATENNIVAECGTAFKAVITMKNTVRKPYSDTGLVTLDSFSFDITDNEKRWHVFTVTKAIQKWRESSRSLHFLYLGVESVLNGKPVSPVKLGFSKEKRIHNNRALLVLFSNDGKTSKFLLKEKADKVGKTFEGTSAKTRKDDWGNQVEVDGEAEEHGSSRVKRSTNVDQVMRKLNSGGSRRRKRKNYCRRKPLYVDFEKLDWGSWVIAPRGYNAYLCEGLCRFPLDKYLRPSNHATVQTILHTVDRSVPPVCCVPNKLSSISMLYIDPENNIVYKKYEDMVVDRCGCS